ncbi:MarR family winged helix-turn-helix transcriptional regulator [Piscibacillus halophilus]|uniref:MarR family winged helix-turn-helix transcriptional regulator n=1 Tax=Piscibacillus halophilus TaxID=571933 RepID=UPI00158F10E0|nr:MarR family transcriptional regulator [Piscibacillus halophilus]
MGEVSLMDESSLPYFIYLTRGLYKAMEKDLNKSAQKLGLTLTELNFIWTIYFEEEATISRMSELTLLDSSTVTQVISRLKNKGLVTTIKKSEDHRYSYVKLTTQGAEKRKLSMIDNQNDVFELLKKDMGLPTEKENVQITLDYLEKINQLFHGDEYVNWLKRLPGKLNSDDMK